MRQAVCNVIAAIVFTAVAVLSYYASDRDPPVVRTLGSISEVSPGTFEVVWNVKKHRVCSGSVTRYIEDRDGDRWPLPSSDVRYPDSKDGVLVNYFKVDPRMACGMVTYHANVSHVCNFTHRLFPIRVTSPVVPFYVSCKENNLQVPANRRIVSRRLELHPN